MLANESLREGRVDEALAHLQEQVRRSPADVRLRVFLFQLLAVMGKWDRALTQLNVAGELDAATLAMVQTYREALRCEALREEIFAGKTSPLVFGEPRQWVALLLEALRLAAAGRYAESQSVRDQAFAVAPATSGRINGEPFAWIADADPRIGPVLEAIVNGRYYWVPFHSIASLRLEAPADLRDLVWLPGELTWANGGQSVGLIPVRYPGSQGSPDHLLRLARRTEWVDHGGGLFTGLGQRMLATDAAEYPLLEVRSLEIDAAVPPES
jgi:type VI secretion system protein ImpE